VPLSIVILGGPGKADEESDLPRCCSRSPDVRFWKHVVDACEFSRADKRLRRVWDGGDRVKKRYKDEQAYLGFGRPSGLHRHARRAGQPHDPR